ncbi:MAG: hypothetical protein HRT77_13395 [Halioglobus sp.]|nr:hypothetical protein [Halioglobus sp.]
MRLTCVRDPGRDVDIYINVELRLMCTLWMGEVSYRRALKEGRLQVIGPPGFARNISEWIMPSFFAEIDSAQRILKYV